MNRGFTSAPGSSRATLLGDCAKCRLCDLKRALGALHGDTEPCSTTYTIATPDNDPIHLLDLGSHMNALKAHVLVV